METSINSSFSISPQQLAARLGRADAPLLLDVRRDAKFRESPRLLAGALLSAPMPWSHCGRQAGMHMPWRAVSRGEKTAQTPKKTLPSGAHSPPRPSSSDLTGG